MTMLKEIISKVNKNILCKWSIKIDQIYKEIDTFCNNNNNKNSTAYEACDLVRHELNFYYQTACRYIHQNNHVSKLVKCFTDSDTFADESFSNLDALVDECYSKINNEIKQRHDKNLSTILGQLHDLAKDINIVKEEIENTNKPRSL